MASFTLRPKAVHDLTSIADYTLEKWGDDQEAIYLQLLHNAFTRLSKRPELGPSCPHIRPGYRKYTVGSHIIFYRIIEENVEIVRILHQSVDIDSQFE